MASSDDADEQEARRLFREAMRDVRRLDTVEQARITPSRRPAAGPQGRRKRAGGSPEAPAMLPGESRLGHEQLPMVGRGEPLEYRASGVAPATLRQLRRGQYPVEGGVDLHGLNTQRATAVLRDFVAEARRERARCVKVVHGKGIGSGDRGPILKTLVNAWLREQPDVLAFVSAPPADGGTGAVYVLLRRPRHAPDD